MAGARPIAARSARRTRVRGAPSPPGSAPRPLCAPGDRPAPHSDGQSPPAIPDTPPPLPAGRRAAGARGRPPPPPPAPAWRPAAGGARPRAARRAGRAPTCRCSSLSPLTVSSTAKPAQPRRSSPNVWRRRAPRNPAPTTDRPITTAAAMVVPGPGQARRRGPAPGERPGPPRRPPAPVGPGKRREAEMGSGSSSSAASGR